MDYRKIIQTIEDDFNIGPPSGGRIGFSGPTSSFTQKIEGTSYYVELGRMNNKVIVTKIISNEIKQKKEKRKRKLEKLNNEQFKNV